MRGRSPTGPCLAFWGVGAADSLSQAQQALAIAREVNDPTLLARALTACGLIASVLTRFELAQAYFAEAIGLARAVDDRRRVSQILAARRPRRPAPLTRSRRARSPKRDATWPRRSGTDSSRAGAAGALDLHSYFRVIWPEPPHNSRSWWPRPRQLTMCSRRRITSRSTASCWCTRVTPLRPGPPPTRPSRRLPSWAGLERPPPTGRWLPRPWCRRCCNGAGRDRGLAAPECPAQIAALGRLYKAQAALAGGDLVAAGRWADDAVSTTTGAALSYALTARARVAIAQGEPDQAERDAYDALARAAEVEAHLFIPDILECLAGLAGDADSHREAARLFGAATSSGNV